MKNICLIFIVLILTFTLSACDLFNKSTTQTPTDTLTVHFIDVGQGDAILIDFGDTEILIDGGKKNTGAAQYISAYVNGPLEAVIVTHFDTDHIGGLLQVFEDYDVSGFWYRGETSGTATADDLMTAVDNENSAIYTVTRGDVIQVGMLQFSVLNPPVPFFEDENNDSIVLLLTYGQTDFLFMGDAEKEAETDMLSMLTDIDILKVGHHGSDSSSSWDFLQIVKPEYAIYMAGIGNSYGHPHQVTINNLNAIGADIFGTDVNGTIRISIQGQNPPQIVTAR
ncbi:MAG: MBL fold metallo-hydrolase [Dehalococcoidales bacterium]|nr:MBL fold metallo-hydrolase [Dehalococcoidales bacterium]